MNAEFDTSTQLTAQSRRQWWQSSEMVALAVAAVLLAAGLAVEWTIHSEPVALTLYLSLIHI